MGGGAWDGHATLKAALDGLATAKGVSATRVKAVANAAFQYAKDYKRVVHDVEIFLWKAEVEHRLAGLYAMDAIMRQSQAKLGAKDPFVKRFSLHMTNTIAAVKKIPADHQDNVRHVVEEWQTRGYYTPQDIEQAGGHEFSLNNPGRPSASSASATVTRASPTHADPASKEKLASLLSIIKKQKELKEQQGDQPLLSQPPLLPTPSSTHRSRVQESPGGQGAPPPRRSSLEDRQHGRSSDGGYARDHGTPPRDRGGATQRGRERSRSRSRDRGGASGARPRDDRSRDRDRSRGHDAVLGAPPRDRRGSSPPISPGRTRGRRDSSDYSRRDSLEDSRDAKKPRSSRWGPPRPSDIGGDDNRPHVIDTRDHERSTRFDSRSPRNRYDGPPGGAAGPGLGAPGQGSWPPTGGYQGPPPPFRSGPSPSHSFPPPAPSGAASSGLLPPPRGGGGDPPDRQTPSSSAYAQASPGPVGGNINGGPPGPGGDYSRSTDLSQGVPPRSATPENAGDHQPMGTSSGEVCRKFVAGRCTFGDRCWHIHNQPGGAQQDGGGPARPPRTEMNQARRKTALCANFPQGNCRYGDRCSFAHGEDDLDKSALTTRRPSPLAQDHPIRSGPSPHGVPFQQQRQSPAVSPHQVYPVTRPLVGGLPAAAVRPPYGAGLPPPANGGNQWAGAAAASGHGAYRTSAAQPTSQAYASTSGGPAALTTPALALPTSSSSSSAPAKAVASRDRAPSRDDDEPEAAGPEFTLQYDEDD